MNNSKNKTLVGIIIIHLLLFSIIVPVNGEVSVIASRISKIGEIRVDNEPAYLLTNHTLFSIDIEVEILNRDDENQTVTEAGDCYPKTRINASLVNQSLEDSPIRTCYPAGTDFTYLPGITTEYEIVRLYIDQSALTSLPDGNYTLDRPINTAYIYGTGEPAEILLTFFHILSGVINVTYSNFTTLTLPDETSAFSIHLTTVLIISFAILLIWRKKAKTYDE